MPPRHRMTAVPEREATPPVMVVAVALPFAVAASLLIALLGASGTETETEPPPVGICYAASSGPCAPVETLPPAPPAADAAAILRHEGESAGSLIGEMYSESGR